MNRHSPPFETAPALAYRPDIDGLRAIAVGSVIAFHAFPQLVSGGFVGVDIFFVISGYLISSIILRASSKGTFSLIDFYARRIRRIFPALITVLACSMVAGWQLLFPDELKQLGSHVLSANFFVLNFTLWSEAGYFDVASELKPLLHLWSLSIEEQFYTLWPITLLFFIKRRNPGMWIAAITLASLLLCVSGLLGKTANFYMPLSRVWELLCGGLLAYAQAGTPSRISFAKPGMEKISNETGALIGLVLLGLAIFMLDSKTLFPGWASLLPTIGASLLIATGPATFINRFLLGNPLFVFIGLISYPLYLWHWPLLSFPKITEGVDLSVQTRLIAVALAFVLAALTYFLIEKPLRHRGKKTTQILLFTALLSALVGALFSSGELHPNAMNMLLEKISATKKDNPFNFPTSQTYGVIIDQEEYRVVGEGKTITLYIGDSNMEQHWQGIEALIEKNNSSRKAMIGGCRIPILNTNAIHPDELDCRNSNTRTFSLAASNADIDTVVLGAQWLGAESFQYVDGDRAYPMNTPEGMQKAMDQLVASIHDLTAHGKKVYLLLNIPGGDEFEPHNLIKRSLHGFQNAIHLEGGVTLDEHKKRTSSISPLLREAAERSGAIILDPADFLCTNNWCSAVSADGEPIYRDIDHLRGTYSRHYPAFIGQTLN